MKQAARKRPNASFSDREKKVIAKSKQSSSLDANPFENIKQSRHKAIMGQNNLVQTKHTSKARSNDIQKRKETLLKDYFKLQKPSNQFIDKRLFVTEKTLQKIDKKRKKFSLDDDEDDIDYKKLKTFTSLGDLDETMDRELFQDDGIDTEGNANAFRGSDAVTILRNLKGIARGETSSTFNAQERQLTKKERMNLKIREYKEMKEERRMEKEENQDLVDILNKEGDEILSLLNKRKKEEKNEDNVDGKIEETKKTSDYDGFIKELLESGVKDRKMNEGILKEEKDDDLEKTSEDEEEGLDEEDMEGLEEALMEEEEEEEEPIIEIGSAKKLDKFIQFLNSNKSTLRKSCRRLIFVDNTAYENEILISSICLLLLEQSNFNEWLEEKCLGTVIDVLTEMLFELVKELAKISHEVLQKVLLKIYKEKYCKDELPNLGELLLMKMILKIYPLNEMNDNVILTMVNYLIHLCLEKLQYFTQNNNNEGDEEKEENNISKILFLTSLAVIIHLETNTYSNEVLQVFRYISKNSNEFKNNVDNKNLLELIYYNKEIPVIEWNNQLLSKYKEHLLNNFPQTIFTTDHYYKDYQSTQGIKTLQRNHIENINLLFKDITEEDNQPIIATTNEVRFPLNYKTKKPKAKQEFEPYIFSEHQTMKGSIADSMKGKLTDKDPEQLKRKLLKRKISRVLRDAKKEIRKDNQFLREVKGQLQRQEAQVRKNKYNEVMDTLKKERMEQNQLDMRNKEVLKMRKQIRKGRKVQLPATKKNDGTTLKE
ncbi:hypothetical protein ABK040_003662 [Willaertia magna]